MFIDEVMASDVVEKFGQDFAYVRRTSLQTFCSIVQKRSLHARMDCVETLSIPSKQF